MRSRIDGCISRSAMSSGSVEAMSVLSSSIASVPPSTLVVNNKENCWRTSPSVNATTWCGLV